MVKKLTIRDIAKMAGVSPTVVSFVINGREGVNAKTREKVLEIIRSTNFRPNLSSRRLTMQKSFNVGIAIETTTSPFNDLFYFEIAQGILAKSKEYGYNVVLSDLKISGNEFSLPGIVEKGDADGMIFFQRIGSLVLKSLVERNIPAVLIDYHGTSETIACVNTDYVRSAFVATKYLMDKGHRDIAFMSQNTVPDFYSQVYKGFSQALETEGMMISPNWICLANDEEQTRNAVDSLLASSKRPTAVFCSTDTIAIDAMRRAKEHGLCLPREMSFIGIDDIIISKYVDPPLTSVRIEKRQMGIMAMELLMKAIQGEKPENIIIESENIIERSSVYDMTANR